MTHFVKPSKVDPNQTYEIDSITARPVGNRSQVQCLLGCDANGGVLAAGGAVVLNPGNDAVCVAVPEVCAGVGIIAGIAIIAALIAAASASHPATILQYSWVNKQTDNGSTVKARKLTSKEVGELEEFGQSFEEIKSEEGYDANVDIYVDKDGNYWIQPPRGQFLIPFP